VAVANFVLSLNMPNSLGSKFFLNLSAINRFSNYVKKIAKRQEAGLYAEVNDTKNYDKIVSDIVPVVKEIALRHSVIQLKKYEKTTVPPLMIFLMSGLQTMEVRGICQ